MNVLEVKNVVKKFGNYAASNNVSFEVEGGQIFGLLGPNGAGKTTLIRMINNILMPDEGEIHIFGEKLYPEQQNRIGYLPEERGLYKKLKVIEQIVYFARLKGLTKHDAIDRAHHWLKKLGANGWENKKIQELSKGMQQKIQFITTVLHSPELIILDEPFSGFDPINTELIKSILLELRSQGKTIILSTHVMSQVEELCDNICMINKGKVVLKGKVSEIKSSYGRNHLIVEFSGDGGFIEKLKNVEILNRTNSRVEMKLLDSNINTNEIIKIITDSVQITRFDLSLPTMHEIFIDTVAKQGESNEQ
jgi:ABC-2 type transport system ATP-binding protein